MGMIYRMTLVVSILLAAFCAPPAWAVLTFEDFTIYAEGKVSLGKNATVQDSSDPDGVYTGKVGSGESAASPGYSLTTADLVKAGDLYSKGDTSVGQNALIAGDIVSNGDLLVGSGTEVSGTIDSSANGTFGKNSELNGNVTVGQTAVFSQNVDAKQNVLSGSHFTGGQSSNVAGNLGANGNVVLNELAEVAGHVTHSGILTLGTNATVGSSSVGSSGVVPRIFSGVSLPGAASFTAGGLNINKGDIQDTTLAPGTYGTLNLGEHNDLYLSAGTYYFDAIHAGSGLDLHLDLTGGDLLLYVLGDVDFGIVLDVVLAGGSAEDIYLETLGSFALGDHGEWYGTVYAPLDDLLIGKNTNIWGSLYSGASIDIQFGAAIERHLCYPFNDQTDPGPVTVPEPSTALLMLLGFPFLRFFRSKN